MLEEYSLQGIPRPNTISLNRGQDKIETISSTGYYHLCCDSQPIKMESNDLARAFTIANQFNGFAEPSPHPSAYHPKCCNYRDSYFQYQGVRLPINFVPQLLEIFNKYHS